MNKINRNERFTHLDIKMQKLFSSIRNINKKRLLVASIIVLAICLLVASSTLAYSIKLKSDGDKEYKNKNYVVALPKYKLAQQWWFLEKISFKLRDRDLYNKLNKTEIMVNSGNNYIKGIDAFVNKKYPEAESYLIKLVITDPHYQEAQSKLAIIKKESLSKLTPVSLNAKPASSSNNQAANNNADNNPNLNPTGIDWNAFEKNINEKLNPATSNNQASQPIPTSTPTPTPTTIPESYNYDSYFPIILSISDSKGNYVKGSNHNGYNGLSGSSFPYPTFKVGDTITWTIEANDPKNRPIQYSFYSYSFGVGVYKNDTNFTHTITIEDLKKSGDTLYMIARIRSDKEYNRDGDYDDSIVISYKLSL